MKNYRQPTGYVIIVLLYSICISYSVFGQKSPMLTIEGTRLTITKGDTVRVNGNILVDSNYNEYYNIHNEGMLNFTDTLFNNVDSLFITSSNPTLVNDSIYSDSIHGKVLISGSDSTYITGNPSIYFNDITVRNTHLTLDTGIISFGSTVLDTGRIFLKNNTIRFYDLNENIIRMSGKLKEDTETPAYHIYDPGTGALESYNNYVDEGEGEGFLDPPNIGFGIKGSLESIFLTRYHYSDPSVTDSSITKVYDLKVGEHVSAGAIEAIHINYLESDLLEKMKGANEKRLGIFRKNVFDEREERYKYIGRDEDYSNEDKNTIQTTTNVSEGRYTVADPECDEMPAADLGGDTILCEGNDVILLPEDTSSYKKWYEWDWSPHYETGHDSTLSYFELKAQ